MPIRNWISSSASIHITSVSSRREIGPKASKNANRNPVSYSTARYRRPSPAISLSTQQILAQQRQSESRVAMTMQPRGRLRSGILDARWRLSRWMMRGERSCLEIVHQSRRPWRDAVRENIHLLLTPVLGPAYKKLSNGNNSNPNLVNIIENCLIIT